MLRVLDSWYRSHWSDRLTTRCAVWMFADIFFEFWYIMIHDVWLEKALDVFLGSPGSVLTRQRCLCPRCCQRWWHPKNMMILSWESETAGTGWSRWAVPAWTLFKFRAKRYVYHSYGCYVLFKKSDIHVKNLQNRMDCWDTGLLSQPTEVHSGTEHTGLGDLPAMYATLVVCNWVNWDAQIISIHIRLSNHCVQEIFDPAENLW